MSNKLSTAKSQSTEIDESISVDWVTCVKCGGNGYMKSTPNCYHTCFGCLGKGVVSITNSSSSS